MVEGTVFIPPQALQKVRLENDQLRLQLRQLSKRLDEFLSSHSHKATPDPASLRSKQLSIAQSQLSQYEKQLKDLIRFQAMLSPTRITDLQQECEELTRKIREKEGRNKEMRRLEKDRGEELSELTVDTGAMTELKKAMDNNRRVQKTVSDLESDLLRGEESFKTVSNRLLLLESKYKDEVNKSQLMNADDEPKPLPVLDKDLETVQNKLKSLEIRRNSEISEFRRNVQSAEAQWELVQQQLNTEKNALKEKERETRVVNLAVKEACFALKLVEKKNGSLNAALKTTPKSSEEEQSSAFVTAPVSTPPAP